LASKGGRKGGIPTRFWVGGKKSVTLKTFKKGGKREKRVAVTVPYRDGGKGDKNGGKKKKKGGEGGRSPLYLGDRKKEKKKGKEKK